MKLIALRFKVASQKPEGVLSSLMRTNIPFSRPHKGDGVLYFTAGVSSRRAVLTWARSEGYRISASYVGIATLLSPLKRHYGTIFGIIVSLFLIYLSTFYVWSVKIEGNSELTDYEIIQLLRECGFSEGIRKSSVDVNELQNTALTRCHELSFISVNIHGMVADVIVHERRTSPRAIDPNAPYNLVADADGVIVSSVILDGQTLFDTGDTVFKGQLLVSGLVDSTSGVTSIRHARGKVYARTSRSLTFEIPFRQTDKIYTHRESIEGYRILGKSFYRKPRDETGSYDIVLTEDRVKLFGLSLPVTRETREVSYYTEKTAVISPEEAEKRAYEEYRGYISTELDTAQLLEESFSIEEKDDGIVLTAEVTAIENIAAEKKFELTDQNHRR